MKAGKSADSHLQPSEERLACRKKRSDPFSQVYDAGPGQGLDLEADQPDMMSNFPRLSVEQ